MSQPRNVSDRILTAVEDTLTAAGARPSEIHKRLGAWSLITVRNALHELVAVGRAEFTGPDCNRRYRRKAGAA